MQSAPTGMLRVSVGTDFGSMHLSPVLGDFLAQFPDVSVNLELDNRYIEMISEGYDAAIRVGEMEDSSLRASKIAVWSQAPHIFNARVVRVGSRIWVRINCCIIPIRQMARFGK